MAQRRHQTSRRPCLRRAGRRGRAPQHSFDSKRQNIELSAFRLLGKACYVASVPIRDRRAEIPLAPSDLTGTLSPKQVADQVGIPERTLRNWVADGVVPAHRTATGRYLLNQNVVPTLKKLAKEMPLNARALRYRLHELQPSADVHIEEDRTAPQS